MLCLTLYYNQMYIELHLTGITANENGDVAVQFNTQCVSCMSIKCLWFTV